MSGDSAKGVAGVPQTYESFVNLVTKLYPDLSKGNQLIARFINQNPNVIALESLNSISSKCQVHPSSLVRFAQLFGYAGFKELQQVFQTRLATAAPGFRERISALDAELSRDELGGKLSILKDLVVRDIASLQGLMESVQEDDLVEAAQLIKNASTIYIAGQLRSEAIANLMRYLLTMVGKKVILLDPAGGLAQEMAAAMGAGDVLVAIAFRHYAQEVVAVTERSALSGVPVIGITDSQLSPLAKDASVLFTIPEEEYSFSRSLAAPMCLVQVIATAVAAEMRPGGDGPPRIPTVTGRVQRRD